MRAITSRAAFGNRGRRQAEVLEQLFPRPAGAVTVPHTNERDRDGVLLRQRLGDEAAETTVDEVVLRCDDGAGVAEAAASNASRSIGRSEAAFRTRALDTFRGE